MLESRELHLELALVTLGALGKDVEDQPSAVDDRTAQRLLEIALLHRRQDVIEYGERTTLLLQSPLDLLDLSGTCEMGGVGSVAAPAHQGERPNPCACREKAQLFDAFGVAARAEVQAHEHGGVAPRRTLSHRAASQSLARPYQLSGEE